MKAAGRAPCRSSCPAGVNAQGYVALIAASKFKEAYELIRERCPLPAACGRVCQHPCEDHCNRGEIDQTELVRLMAGGSELAELEHELANIKAEVGGPGAS